MKKNDVKVVYFDDLTEEIGVEDHYSCMDDDETDAEILERLLKHLETIDKKYCDIVTMKLAGISMKEIFKKLQLKSNQGNQVVDECEHECRKYFGLRYCAKK